MFERVVGELEKLNGGLEKLNASIIASNKELVKELVAASVVELNKTK